MAARPFRWDVDFPCYIIQLVIDTKTSVYHVSGYRWWCRNRQVSTPLMKELEKASFLVLLQFQGEGRFSSPFQFPLGHLGDKESQHAFKEGMLTLSLRVIRSLQRSPGLPGTPIQNAQLSGGKDPSLTWTYVWGWSEGTLSQVTNFPRMHLIIKIVYLFSFWKFNSDFLLCMADLKQKVKEIYV